MNTLEKVSKLEAKISVLETMVQNLVSSNGSLEKLNLLEKQNREIFAIISEKQDLIVNRIMSIEQSFAAMAKTVNAVIQELEESSTLNSNNVMKKIRAMDERAEKERVKTMLEVGAIEATTLINENSMLAVSQTFHSEGQASELVSEYRVYELNSPLNTKETVEAFTGKSVGDVVEITVPEGKIATTIVEVYNYKKMESQNLETKEESKQAPTA